MARETGEEVNRAIVEGDRDGLGLGAAVGRYLARRRPAAPSSVSLLAAAWRLGLPATVHVAMGTDIVHMHPACDPAALGRATHLDFRIFAAEVARLGGGGVYLNVGSAVLLPEVFLKAVTLARNLGHDLTRLRHRQPRLHPVLPAQHQRGASARRAAWGAATASPATTRSWCRCSRPRSWKGPRRSSARRAADHARAHRPISPAGVPGDGRQRRDRQGAGAGLARLRARVVLACRDPHKGEAVRREIAAATGNPRSRGHDGRPLEPRPSGSPRQSSRSATRRCTCS